MRKLRYVDHVARAVGTTEPPVRLASTDITVEEMDMTVEEFFQAAHSEAAPVEATLDTDLPDFFVRKRGRSKGLRPAADLVRQNRADLINKIEYWTGVRRYVVRALVDSIGEAAERLQLYVDTRGEAKTLVELTAYATTLSMNYLTRGSFVPRAGRAVRGPRPVAARGTRHTDGDASNRDRPPA